MTVAGFAGILFSIYAVRFLFLFLSVVLNYYCEGSQPPFTF